MYIIADFRLETVALKPIIMSALSLGFNKMGTEFFGEILNSEMNFSREEVWFSWKKKAVESMESSLEGKKL